MFAADDVALPNSEMQHHNSRGILRRYRPFSKGLGSKST